MSPKKGKDKQSSSTEAGEGQKRIKIDELTVKLSTEETEINELLEENYNLGDDLARKAQQLKVVNSKLKDAEEELKKAKYEIELLRSERKCLLITNRNIQAKANRVDELEEALESLRVSISRQKEVSVQPQPSEREQLMKQKYKSLKASAIGMASELQEWTSIEPGVKPGTFRDEYRQLKQEHKDMKAELEAFRRERDELQRTHGQEENRAMIARRNATNPSADRQQPAPDSNNDDEPFDPARFDDDDVSNDHDPSDEPVRLPDNKTEERYIRIKVGKLGKYYILVSDARWLNMDWTKEYTYVERAKVICKKCQKLSYNLRDAADHSWVEHYGGHFKCAYCDKPSQLKYRHSFKTHMKKQHPSILT